MSSTGSAGAELDILGTSPGKGIRSVPLHVEKAQSVVYFQKAPGAEFRSRSPEVEDPSQVCGYCRMLKWYAEVCTLCCFAVDRATLGSSL